MHLEIVFESSFDHLEKAIEEAERFTAALENDEDFVYNVVLLASEAVTNAVEHGNAMDASKRVTMRMDATPEEIVLSVQDEGKGFSPKEIPDPLKADNLLASGGRGIYLIEHLADKVDYEDQGRRIVMRFRRPGR